MKKYRFALAAIALVALLVCAGAALAQCHGHEHNQANKMAAEESRGAPMTGLKEMEGNTCPVMGGAIDKKYSYAYKGTIYYFCCPACIPKFKENPEKYIGKMTAK